MNNKAFEVLEILNKFGKSFIVGGAVRDFCMGLKISDIDICTNITMKKIEELFETYDIGKNKNFGVVCIKYKGETFEIAQFRNESNSKYLDGRRPDSVEFVNDVESDLSRRDITINSFAMDIDGNIIDPFGGLNDIKNKIIRMVGDPFERLSEDFLRLLRLIRFSNRFDFTIEENTFKALCENASKIQLIAKERIHQEVVKMCNLGGKKFAKCIEDMDKCGLLKYIYPEVENLKNFEHSYINHPESPNVFGHVISALKSYEGVEPRICLSILFHDIGKQLTHTYNEEKDKHQYLGHDFEGYKLIKDVLAEKYCWSNDLKEITSFCALEHMKFHNISNMKNSKILRLMNSKYWDILFQVAKADSYESALAT